jgi:hypothetical protein
MAKAGKGELRKLEDLCRLFASIYSFVGQSLRVLIVELVEPGSPLDFSFH